MTGLSNGVRTGAAQVDNVKLPLGTRESLRLFVGRLQAVYGGDLVSVVLYGSAASGEFANRHSNVNVMVVLNDTALPNLARAHPIVTARKFRMISPVFFTEEYIASSADVFPIEFLDIKENYAMLFGKDVVKDIRIDTKNLRFQCEQELKSKIIHIKKHYLVTADRSALEHLLFKSFTSSLHILRNIVRLKGVQPPYLREEILSDVEAHFGVDTTVLSEILWAKNKNMALEPKDIESLLAGLVKELECISGVVDKM
jgi:predicted nucleotidyltransferase